MHSFKAHGRYLLKCAFSPDSQRLVTTSADKTARLWRAGGRWDCEQVRRSRAAGAGSFEPCTHVSHRPSPHNTTSTTSIIKIDPRC